LRGQVLRFGIVGVLNTFVDIGLLNLLSWLFESYHGSSIFGLNTISYAVATVNSYLLNKYWTFGDRGRDREALKFSQFVSINVVGAFINSSIVSGLTTYLTPPALLLTLVHQGFGLLGARPWSNGVIWLNSAKLVATAVVMTLNFVLYRYWVFRAALHPAPDPADHEPS